MMKNGLGLLTVCSTAALLCTLSGLDAAPTPAVLSERLFRVFRIFLDFKDSDISGMALHNVLRRAWVSAEPCLLQGFSQLDLQQIEPVVTFFETDKNCLPALESKQVFSENDVNLCIDAMSHQLDPVLDKVNDVVNTCIAMEELRRDMEATRREPGNDNLSYRLLRR